MGAAPRSRPASISAIVSFSSPTARSVVSSPSMPGSLAACSDPAPTWRATAASASPTVTSPGFQASAAASRSVRENTASRSERCATAHSTARAAADSGTLSEPRSRPDDAMSVPPSSTGSPPLRAPSRLTPRCPVSGATAPGAASLPAPSRSAPLAAACAPSARASKPRSPAWRCQTAVSSSRSMSRLAARLTSAARSARRGLSDGLPMPRSAIPASISARRVENASITSRETPAISNRPSARVFSIP